MIAVLDYGIGNLRSAEKALLRVGGDARLVTDPDEAAGASAVVLPGVGAFGPCAAALRRTGLDRAALDSISRGIPFLGICIGFQLLYEGSEEDPGSSGLSVLGGTVRRLPPGVKHPQMQWNSIRRRRTAVRETAEACREGGGGGTGGDSEGGGGGQPGLLAGLPEEPWVYFVHSFAPEMGDDVVATCDYGGDVVAAAERGTIWGTQFHPEKSGTTGLMMLANFVHASKRFAGAGA